MTALELSATGRQRSSDVRARTMEHGGAVSRRGRILRSVAEQYQAAAERP